jgi:hypothetical protein
MLRIALESEAVHLRRKQFGANEGSHACRGDCVERV